MTKPNKSRENMENRSSSLAPVDSLLNFKPRKFRILLSKKAVNDHVRLTSGSIKNSKDVSLKTILCSSPVAKPLPSLSFRKTTVVSKFNGKDHCELVQETNKTNPKTINTKHGETKSNALLSKPVVRCKRSAITKMLSTPNNIPKLTSENEIESNFKEATKTSKANSNSNTNQNQHQITRCIVKVKKLKLPISNAPTLIGLINAPRLIDKIENFEECETVPRTPKLYKSRIFTAKNYSQADEINCNTSELDKNTIEPRKKCNSFNEMNENRENVYDFSSESSSPSEDEDDDVIKKLVNEGRAKIIRHRPIIKNKNKTVTLKNKATKRNRANLKKKKVEDKITKVIDDVLTPRHNIQEANSNNNKEETNNLSKGSRFSILARSIMKKQTERMNTSWGRPMVTDPKKLLKVAQEFVSHSTPQHFNKEQSFAPQCSPLQPNNLPWRNEVENLPTIFNFSLNSNHLPTYGSDFIPSTPSKDKTKSILNDSNEENIQPPSNKKVSNKDWYKLSLNPKRVLFQRSPLKPINIISVTQLPPLSRSEITKIQDKMNDDNVNKDTLKQFRLINNEKSEASPVKPAENNLESEEGVVKLKEPTLQSEESNLAILGENTLESEASPAKHEDNTLESEIDVVKTKKVTLESEESGKTNENTYKNDDKDPFGFHEIITDEEPSFSQPIKLTSNLSRNRTHLRHLLPKTKPTRFTYSAIKPIFKSSECKSRNIKEMLTSTKIYDSTSKFNQNNDISIDTTNNDSLAQSLFTDPDPETTFDTKSIRRTYCGTIRKKPKLRHHNFVMFLDSEDSGSEQENICAEKHRKHKKKRKKTTAQENPHQLNEFVKKFNSMCQEVEEFPIIIE